MADSPLRKTISNPSSPAKNTTPSSAQSSSSRTFHRPQRSHHNAPKTIQAALLPSTAFGDLLSPSKVAAAAGAPHTSRSDPAREDGSHAARVSEADREEESRRRRKEEKKSREVKEKELKRCRAERVLGESQLRARLESLSALSTVTTRRLDYTFYSLLSTIPSMNKALAQVDDLASDTSRLLSAFKEKDIPSMADETRAHVNGLESNLDDMRENRIRTLESRMRTARDNVLVLGDRVQDIRKRVDASEQRESAGKRRKRWWRTFIWRLLIVALVVVLMGMLTKGWHRVKEEVRKAREMATEVVELITPNASLPGEDDELAKLFKDL